MEYTMEQRHRFCGYKEDVKAGNAYRSEYLAGIEKLLEEKKKEAEKKRSVFDRELVDDIEGHRKMLIDILGWPLNEYKKDGVPNVKETYVTSDNGVDIIRMQLEVLPNVWFYGILFKKGDEKRPLVISQHGGEGTPEMTAGMYKRECGCDSSSYNDMTNRVLQYDVNVFAPQMLLWSKTEYELDVNRGNIDGLLKMFGGTITAFELFALRKTLDYFETQDFVDENNIGMVGLSYGGMYTLFLSAIDTRIKSAISSSYFCDHFKSSWQDWTYPKTADNFLDAEVAMLSYPRRLFIAICDEDELFALEDTKNEFKRIAVCGMDDKITLHPYKGGHEFLPKDDSLIEELINELK